MRPQHITAENEYLRRHAGLGDDASMRPQHITAENARHPVGRRADVSASMRPQHITAENPPHPTDMGMIPRGFNEAAAYHCGKLSCRGAYPASSGKCFNEAAAYHCGKRGARDAPHGGRRAASMRPQHITAENRAGLVLWAGRLEASMRPQHITAENVPCPHAAWPSRFASMRPQHITAENWLHLRPGQRLPGCFNEAAAYHCGKLPYHVMRSRGGAGFNEAAAYHCGKLPRPHVAGRRCIRLQ